MALENESFLKLFFLSRKEGKRCMREVELNPYVIQIDKFVNSLEKLSQTFLHLEDKQCAVSDESYQKMQEDIRERVCKSCERYVVCHEQKILYELLHAVEHYGAELNVEVKRKLQQKCIRAPKFLKTVLDLYQHEKQAFLWKQRIAENREDCAVQLDSFAQMIRHSTRELNASIFSDEHLEKKLKARLAKLGLKQLSSVFLISESGRYEIHVTLKALKGRSVAAKEVAKAVSLCTGRNMVLGKEARTVIGAEYHTVVCVEGARFQTLPGVAKIGKGCEKISGDSFSLLELAGGKQGAILSDGMGFGERAFRESAMVVEVLEELLHAGFPQDTALQMLNTAMVMGREEIRFSTIDMCFFDSYSGECELLKAGASTTFIKTKQGVEQIKSSSLPLGVVSRLEVDRTKRQLEDGDLIIMVTDGVMDALPVGEQDFLMKMIVEGTKIHNPKEIAHHILEQVLECSGEVPLDDMTVLVVGIWSLEN